MFDSWQGERAVAYRRAEGIPDDWGTAVNVQQMVFGNKGDTSGSGVAFSRDFATGAPGLSGDFLVNAQGEDVVSGNRSTLDIAELADVMPDAHAELAENVAKLESHYRNMQDVEFTVEEGQALLPADARRQAPAGGVDALRVRRGDGGAAGDRRGADDVQGRRPRAAAARAVRPRRTT